MHSAPFSDRDLLTLMEMKAEGRSNGEVARILHATRSKVAGAHHRITLGCPADPEQDGTLPARWWEPGLKKQEARRDS